MHIWSCITYEWCTHLIPRNLMPRNLITRNGIMYHLMVLWHHVVLMSILTQTWKKYLYQGMFLTWVSICLVTASLIIIVLVCLKSVLICQGGFWEHFILDIVSQCYPCLNQLCYHGSQLWSLFLIKHITQLEKIQRSFTRHITWMNDMPYHERLKSLGLYSLQRRRERYCIIYIWKIIDGLSPNFSNPITSTVSGRRGRSCVISNVNVGRVGTLAYNSFRWRSIRLFNILPMHLRSISSCSVLRFKTQLYIFQWSVEALPCLPGFNNSLDGGDCRWRSPRDGMATN